jgi:hypothetical protein
VVLLLGRAARARRQHRGGARLAGARVLARDHRIRRALVARQTFVANPPRLAVDIDGLD